MMRKLFVTCMALVIVARTVHCLYVDVTLCGAVKCAPNESAPLTNPDETDPNESGCLCKGAVLGGPCLLADLHSQARLACMAKIVCETGLVIELSSFEQAAQDRVWSPPVSGRPLRALISSWQI